MNTRYVNYGIDNKGEYYSRSIDKKIKTKNGMTYLNKNYSINGLDYKFFKRKRNQVSWNGR